MKLEEYKILNNTLVLKFDRKFRQIRLVKLELIDESKVDTDNIEMKFSKEKDEIMLFIKESMIFAMLYINMIDSEESNNAYYIKNDMKDEKNNIIKCDIKDSIGMGGMGDIGMLIKSKAGDFFSNVGGGDGRRVCLLKSENIFAEISRKKNNERVKGIRVN